MSEIEWGDEKALGSKPNYSNVKKFRGKRDKTERIYIIEKKATAAWTHYYIRGYFKCLAERTQTTEGVKVNKHTCPLCRRVSDLLKQDEQQGIEYKDSKWKGSLAKLRIGTNVIYYNTDRSGEPTEPFNVETRVWIMDAKKYAALGAIKKEWGELQNYDIKVDCDDEQFQKIRMTNTKTAQCLQDGRRERTFQEYEKNKSDIAKELCMTLTVEQLVQRIKDLEESVDFGEPESDSRPSSTTSTAVASVTKSAPMAAAAPASTAKASSTDLDDLLNA